MNRTRFGSLAQEISEQPPQDPAGGDVPISIGPPTESPGSKELLRREEGCEAGLGIKIEIGHEDGRIAGTQNRQAVHVRRAPERSRASAMADSSSGATARTLGRAK